MIAASSLEPGDGAAFVKRALDSVAARAPADAIARITVAAPLADPLALPGLSLLWEPPRGPTLAGSGVAAELCVAGPDRFTAARDGAAAIFARLVDVSEPGAGGVPARLLGGFAFASDEDDGGGDDPAWRGFADGALWLPRLAYWRDDHSAWLSLSTSLDDRAGAPREVAAALASLSRNHVELCETPALATLSELDRAAWRRRVEAIRSGIAADTVAKVVAARRSEIALAADADPRSLLARLRRGHRGCYRFAFQSGDGVFLGASPERLVQRRGARVATEALAGSIAAGAGKDALLASDKDRGEQAVVVRAIADALAPLCSELDVPGEPRLRELRDVVHLETLIEGTLAAPTHVLDLVAALHPTPAVGGVPRARALSWIAAAEEHARGWYAGPVGWLDAEGDGEFAVAIRSGLVRGRAAYLYAGAGIVADSEADAEYDETGLKQRALLDALGVAAGRLHTPEAPRTLANESST